MPPPIRPPPTPASRSPVKKYKARNRIECAQCRAVATQLQRTGCQYYSNRNAHHRETTLAVGERNPGASLRQMAAPCCSQFHFKCVARMQSVWCIQTAIETFSRARSAPMYRHVLGDVNQVVCADAQTAAYLHTPTTTATTNSHSRCSKLSSGRQRVISTQCVLVVGDR